MAKLFESWRLLGLLALGLTVANSWSLPTADFHSARGTAPLIVGSVRYALPFFLLAFTASAWARLWPGKVTRWLLRNRRFFGLAFAFGMAWHLSFVAYSVFSFGMSASGLTIRGLLLDLTGVVFLFLMTLTSFRWSARRLTTAHWRRLHKTGVYAIWFVATYIYLHHPEDLLHILAFSLLIVAWLLRISAWVKGRVRGLTQNPTRVGTSK